MSSQAQANQFNLPNRQTAGYELKRLREKHHLCLRMHLRGVKNVDIAKTLGTSEVWVSYTINSKLGQQKIAALRGEAEAQTIDALGELKELAPLAVAVQEEIMLYGDKDSDRLRASESILDRAGHGKNTTVNVNHNIPSKEEIAELRQKSLESARNAGIIAQDAEEDPEIEDAVIIDEDEG